MHNRSLKTSPVDKGYISLRQRAGRTTQILALVLISHPSTNKVSSSSVEFQRIAVLMLVFIPTRKDSPFFILYNQGIEILSKYQRYS